MPPRVFLILQPGKHVFLLCDYLLSPMDGHTEDAWSRLRVRQHRRHSSGHRHHGVRSPCVSGGVRSCMCAGWLGVRENLTPWTRTKLTSL